MVEHAVLQRAVVGGGDRRVQPLSCALCALDELAPRLADRERVDGGFGRDAPTDRIG